METKKKKNKWLKRIGIFAGLLLLFVFIGKKAGWIGKSGVTKVAVEKVSRHDITEVVSASGKIYPKVEVKISPDVSGEVTELNVVEGDSVTAGQVMAKIKPDIYAAELESASAGLNTLQASLLSAKSQLTQTKAAFDAAQLTYDRNKKLHDNKVISDAEWEQNEVQFKGAKATYESAQQNVDAAGFNIKSGEARVKQAVENLSKTTITAPMSGIVSSLNVVKGDRVVGTSQFTGTEMMRISKLDAVEARVDVSENDVLKITIGDTAKIELDAYPDRKFSGVVTEVAVSSKNTGAAALATDQVTNFTVKILLNRDSYMSMMDTKHKKFPFLPGMTASVKIMTKRVNDVLSVPIQSVTTREDSAVIKGKKKSSDAKTKEVVFVFENGKVKMKEVHTGIQDNEFIEIKDGLKENEQVVSAPFNEISKLLHDDEMVQVEDKEKLYKEDEK